MPKGVTSTAIIKVLDVPELAERHPCLLFVTGMEAGKVLPLDLREGPLTIGRGDDVDIKLDEPEISRHHARIELEAGGQLRLVDLGSRNGTYVNDERIVSHHLRADDKIRIGPLFRLKLTYQDDDEIRFADQLFNRAVSDPLTGIVNRAFFRSTLDREWSFAARHKQNIALHMCDIDRFKSINDSLGHQAGDAVLRGLVKRLQENTRLEDLLGRFGGEEFVVLLRDTGLSGAAIVAERIRRAVAERPFVIGDETIWVTVSIGVASLGPDEMQRGTPDDLIRLADERLYAAKAAGRNRVMCDLRESRPDPGPASTHGV